MHSNGTLPLDAPLAARCGYSLRVLLKENQTVQLLESQLWTNFFITLDAMSRRSAVVLLKAVMAYFMVLLRYLDLFEISIFLCSANREN